jgi:hypothetical protein
MITRTNIGIFNPEYISRPAQLGHDWFLPAFLREFYDKTEKTS